MALWDKFVDIVNKRMDEKAEQILDEVHRAGYEAYPTSTKVVPSFHIMGKSEGAEVSRSYGLTRSITIGSTLREARWAVYGNGGKGRIIRSKRAVDSRGRRPGKLGEYPDGIPGYGWRSSVHGYDGKNFLKVVVRKHR